MTSGPVAFGNLTTACLTKGVRGAVDIRSRSHTLPDLAPGKVLADNWSPFWLWDVSKLAGMSPSRLVWGRSPL